MRINMKGVAMLLLMAAAPLLGSQSAIQVHLVSPQLAVGPKATHVAVPGDAIFTCQEPGASPICYAPSQIRGAYNIQALLDQGYTGVGKTIVIIDAFQSPTLPQDMNVFDSVFGLPPMSGLDGPNSSRLATFQQIAPDGLTPFDGTDPTQVSWSGEISLDVEWAHAIAPGANIVLVLAKSNADTDILSATKYAVDHRLGDVISQSFGENEACVDPSTALQQHAIFVEATLKNISLFASTGDLGAAVSTCDGSSLVKGVSSPAVDPLVVAVGGTALTATLDGAYVEETTWNDPFGAPGGGYSVLYKKPFYQLAAVRGHKRGIADVAYDAAVSTGFLVAWSQGDPANVGQFFIFGGTSAGSPQWAALIALADQRAGYDLGFINQGLYLLGLHRHRYSESFHDITTGNNSVEVQDASGNILDITGYEAERGWDPPTGLGSPNGITFVDKLLRYVSPLDGWIGIFETEPLSHEFASRPGHHHPH